MMRPSPDTLIEETADEWAFLVKNLGMGVTTR